MTNRKLLMRNHQCKRGMLYSWRVSGWFLIGSELDPRGVDEILEVEEPPANHLQRQREHREKQQHGDAVPDEIELRVEFLHQRLGQRARQDHVVQPEEEDAGELLLKRLAYLVEKRGDRRAVGRDQLRDDVLDLRQALVEPIELV